MAVEREPAGCAGAKAVAPDTDKATTKMDNFILQYVQNEPTLYFGTIWQRRFPTASASLRWLGGQDCDVVCCDVCLARNAWWRRPSLLLSEHRGPRPPTKSFVRSSSASPLQQLSLILGGYFQPWSRPPTQVILWRSSPYHYSSSFMRWRHLRPSLHAVFGYRVEEYPIIMARLVLLLRPPQSQQHVNKHRRYCHRHRRHRRRRSYNCSKRCLKRRAPSGRASPSANSRWPSTP